MTDEQFKATSDELRQFIERVERLNAEIADIQEQSKDVLAEAKARGYDTKVMKQIIRDRKKDTDTLNEEKSIYDLYSEALGM